MRYLAKYSPDLNPIEQAFSKLKAQLRKAAGELFRVSRARSVPSRRIQSARMCQLLSTCRLRFHMTGMCSLISLLPLLQTAVAHCGNAAVPAQVVKQYRCRAMGLHPSGAGQPSGQATRILPADGPQPQGTMPRAEPHRRVPRRQRPVSPRAGRFGSCSFAMHRGEKVRVRSQ